MERGKRTKGLKYEPKLAWEQVNAIRRDYRWHSRTAGGAALARRYGVSANTIHKIIHGRIWRLSDGDRNVPPPNLGRPNWEAVLRYEQQLEQHLDALIDLMI